MPGDDVVDEKFYDPHGTEINFNEQKRWRNINPFKTRLGKH